MTDSRTVHMPDGNPAPEILEPAEVAKFLRIEAKGVMGVLRTLRKRGLGYVRISGRVMFPLTEVLAFMQRESETNKASQSSNNGEAKEGTK